MGVYRGVMRRWAENSVEAVERLLVVYTVDPEEGLMLV
jgi:hypothetical protein